LILDAATLNSKLPELGYKHLAFISYARARFRHPANTMQFARAVRQDPLRKRAEVLKSRLEEALVQTFIEPSVFSDSDLPDGAAWEAELAAALYSSVIVIAICDPVYFTDAKAWCAREWFSALEVDGRRPRANTFGTFVHATTQVPSNGLYPPWSTTQQTVDLSAMSATGWTGRSKPLREWVFGLHNHIQIVASHWITQGIRAEAKAELLNKTWPEKQEPTPKYPLAA